MNEQCGRQRKCEKVDYRVGTREVQRAVGLVIAEAELAARGVEDSCDIVRTAEAVVHVLSTDGHIREVPGLWLRAFVRTMAHGRGPDGRKEEGLRWYSRGSVAQANT